MSNNTYFSDPSLQVLRITDFTPGIVRFARGATSVPLYGGTGQPYYTPSYATAAPVGSAANSVRCMAIKSVGLVPFPVYRPVSSYTQTAGADGSLVQLGNMKALAAFHSGPTAGTYHGDDLIQLHMTEVLTSGTTYNLIFDATRVTVPAPQWNGGPVATPTSILNATLASTPNSTLMWPTMDHAIWHDTTVSADVGYRRSTIFTWPASYSWVTIGSWNSPTPPPTYSTGPLPTPAAYTPRVFYHASRAGVFHSSNPAVDSGGWGGSAVDELSVSNQLDPTAWNFSVIPYGEMGNSISCWGSISTGELIMIYGNGGAALLYGDMLQIGGGIVKLPGVAGPGAVIGPGAYSPAGLIYATDIDGAYSWNGDNASTKISNQIPDDVLYRIYAPPGFTSDFPRLHASQEAWGNWVMFPNNWVYDTITQSWWQVEDTNIVNFQVHTSSNQGPKSFYSAPGFTGQGVAAGQPVTLTTYGWDRTTPQTSYTWVSNPLPVTQGALVTIQTVELVASNTSTSPCTVTVTPGVPAGQTPLQQPNQSQQMVFNIPANTVGWRGSQRCGYRDYNVMLNVAASNNSTSFGAPTIHEISVAYSPTRTAGVQ